MQIFREKIQKKFHNFRNRHETNRIKFAKILHFLDEKFAYIKIFLYFCSRIKFTSI